jgi:hypothetical protein
MKGYNVAQASNILCDLGRPLLRRAGTFSAGALIAFGFPADLAHSAVSAGTAFLLICVDLALSKKARN